MLNRTKSRRCRKREAGAFPDLSVLAGVRIDCEGKHRSEKVTRIGMKSNETKAIMADGELNVSSGQARFAIVMLNDSAKKSFSSWKASMRQSRRPIARRVLR